MRGGAEAAGAALSFFRHGPRRRTIHAFLLPPIQKLVDAWAKPRHDEKKKGVPDRLRRLPRCASSSESDRVRPVLIKIGAGCNPLPIKAGPGATGPEGAGRAGSAPAAVVACPRRRNREVRCRGRKGPRSRRYPRPPCRRCPRNCKRRGRDLNHRRIARCAGVTTGASPQGPRWEGVSARDPEPGDLSGGRRPTLILGGRTGRAAETHANTTRP